MGGGGGGGAKFQYVYQKGFRDPFNSGSKMYFYHSEITTSVQWNIDCSN